MKIKNILIIILMTTFFIVLGTKVDATTGIIKQDTVKLRKQPDSKTVLDYVYEGDEVEILELENKWYKVKATTELGKITGYINEDEIDVENSSTTEEKTPIEIPIENPTEVEEKKDSQDTTPVVSTKVEKVEEEKEYILSEEVNVKTLPLISSRKKGNVNGNIKIIEKINDWCRIESDTENGWIRTVILKKALAPIETPVESEKQPEEIIQQEQTEITQPEKQPEPITQPNETTKKEQEVEKQPNVKEDTVATEINKTGYVSAEGLRVRKGPSTDTEELTSLSKNDKVEIIGQEGKWYKIKIKGEIGYISAKYISDTKLPETTSRSGSTLRNETDTSSEENNVVKSETKAEPEATEPEKEAKPESEKTGTTGGAIVEYAKKYLGYKYVSGGASPSKGFDCSGFTTYVYKHFGISLNRTSGAQINNGVAVSKADLQPGDLVIFNNDANTKIGHVGIYVGDGNFIHASNPSDGVKITTLTSGYYHKRYVGARRVY